MKDLGHLRGWLEGVAKTCVDWRSFAQQLSELGSPSLKTLGSW